MLCRADDHFDLAQLRTWHGRLAHAAGLAGIQRGV
jgi:hypothetical protein